MTEALKDRCQYRIQYEPYSWCVLSDNICVMDTGNSLFDEVCENNTTKGEGENGKNDLDG